MDCPIKATKKENEIIWSMSETAYRFHSLWVYFPKVWLRHSFLPVSHSIYTMDEKKTNRNEIINKLYKMNVFDDKNHFNVSPVGSVHSSRLLNTHPCLRCERCICHAIYFPSPKSISHHFNLWWANERCSKCTHTNFRAFRLQHVLHVIKT